MAMSKHGVVKLAFLTACGWSALFASAAAQTVSSDQASASAANSSVSEVVVTATRVNRAGFVAPTPTTVVDRKDIQLAGRASLGDVLADLPSEQASTTPTSTTGSTNAGSSYANLRDFGNSRTLVLIDGYRPVLSNRSGVDLGLVPLSLVKRVDIVTGGASADWGSDAVAGVVNIVLDDHFNGLATNAQFGENHYGKGDQYKLSLAGGTDFANGHGHVMADIDYDNTRGAYPRRLSPAFQDGTIANPAYTATNGQPQLLLLPRINLSTASLGGLIVSGPLAGTAFGAGGSTYAFQYGADRSTSVMSGGDPTSGATDDYRALSAPVERTNFYTRSSYAFNDKAVLTADLSLSRLHSLTDLYPVYAAGNLTLSVNNAFLPTPVRTALLAAGQTSFKFGRLNPDFGSAYNDLTEGNEQGVLGLHGDLGHTWSYEAFVSYAETQQTTKTGNQPVSALLANSLNSVINPANGQPVCAITLSTGATCVPVNPFGFNTVSTAALSYFMGASILHANYEQTEVSAILRGEPFRLWAGPVSFVGGLEYRDLLVRNHSDPITQAGGFSLVNLASLARGSQQVVEGFGEAVVPLLRDLPFVKALDLNAAVRVSHYNSSGDITSWKVGLTDTINDELRLRATVSRDIRAPNLAELFVGQTTGTGTILDPATHASVLVTTYGGGNPNLRPETADTVTAGFIYSPGWLHGLQLSVDAYRIALFDAITTLSAQTIVTTCATNNDPNACSQITRTGGVITSVNATYINLAKQTTSGLDVEADYGTDLAALRLPGKLTVRYLGTYVGHLTQTTGLSLIELAGDVGSGTPHWRDVGTATYVLGDLSAYVRERTVGGGRLSKQLTIDRNSVGTITYFDLGAEWRVPRAWSRYNLTAYANVQNVDNSVDYFHQNTSLYDVIGRSFNVGVRSRF